jgi:transposase
MISLEVRSKIRRLFFGEHWKVGTIVSELGVHADAVKHAIEVDRFRLAPRPPGPSHIDPYKAFVLETLEKYPRLRATRLYEMIRSRGYDGSVTQVRRFVKKVRPRKREAFFRLETLAGEQGQVDWASFGTIRIGHAERKLSCFVMVLSHSRAIYARFALDQTLESFIRGHVLAFQFFGGVPRKLLYDNLKSVVLERDGDIIRFHPRILELAGHYHFAPVPCAPYRGNEKGKVERSIHYLRYSFFEGRNFTSQDDLNTQLAYWLDQVAMARVRQDATVRERFEKEQPLLLPLPQHPFETELVKGAASGKTPYVRFDGNDYSIPHTLVRQPLTLSANETRIRILDATTEVANHPRSYDKGQRIEIAAHFDALADEKRQARELRGRDRLRAECPRALSLLESIALRGEPLRAHTLCLLDLLDRYGAQELDIAIQDALAKSTSSAQSVAHILDQKARTKRQLPTLPRISIDPKKSVHVTPHKLNAYDQLAQKTEKSS